MASLRLGNHHFLGVSAGSGGSGANELKTVSDSVTINTSPNVGEFAMRGSRFVKAMPGNIALTISGTCYYDPTDPAFAILQAAATATNATAQVVSITVKDGAGTTYPGISVTETLSGVFIVSSWERSEPVDDAVTQSFELRPAGTAEDDPIYG